MSSREAFQYVAVVIVWGDEADWFIGETCRGRAYNASQSVESHYSQVTVCFAMIRVERRYAALHPSVILGPFSTQSGIDQSRVRFSGASRFSYRASRFRRSLTSWVSVVEHFHGLFGRWLNFGLAENSFRQVELKCRLPKEQAAILISVESWQ